MNLEVLRTAGGVVSCAQGRGRVCCRPTVVGSILDDVLLPNAVFGCVLSRLALTYARCSISWRRF